MATRNSLFLTSRGMPTSTTMHVLRELADRPGAVARRSRPCGTTVGQPSPGHRRRRICAVNPRRRCEDRHLSSCRATDSWLRQTAAMVLYASDPARRARQVAADVLVLVWIVACVRLGQAVHTATLRLAEPGRQLEAAGRDLGSGLHTAAAQVGGLP